MSQADDEKTANAIIDAVSAAVVAAAPLAGPAAPAVVMGVAGVRAIVSLLEQLGHGDAIREALDAELVAGRALTDKALAAKHAHDAIEQRSDEPTVEIPPPSR
jgi:hypothetical protein